MSSRWRALLRATVRFDQVVRRVHAVSTRHLDQNGRKMPVWFVIFLAVVLVLAEACDEG